MENKQSEMGYIESTIAHVSQENHRQGIHIWLDVNGAGDGILLSVSHNFNGSDGTEHAERVIQVLEDVLKSVKLRTMGSEHPEIAEVMRFMEGLENGGNENEYIGICRKRNGVH